MWSVTLRALSEFAGISTFPPCSSMMLWTIARPKPVPPETWDREESSRKNRSNTLGSASDGMPTPVSLNFDVNRQIFRAGSQHDRSPGWRVRYGVRHQIADCALHQGAVQFSDYRRPVRTGREGDTRLRCRSFVILAHAIEQLDDIDCFAAHMG